jgi:hypothetical protein
MFRAILLVLLVGCASVEIPQQPVKETPQPITSVPRSLFPNQMWANRVWDQIKEMPKVSDEKEFCPRGLTRENWLHLFAAIAKNESNFNPSLTYRENFKNSRGEYVISTGLYQVSYESAGGYGFRGLTTEQLKDPFLNTDVAVAIVKRLSFQDGRLAGKKANGQWAGAARYFSVFRTDKVKNTIRQWCQ